MKAVSLKSVKNGEFFTLNPHEFPKESQVWERGPYDRETKKFECYRFDNVCAFHQWKGDKQVYVDFIF